MELRLLGLPKKSLQQAEKPFLPTLWAIVTDVLVDGLCDLTRYEVVKPLLYCGSKVPGHRISVFACILIKE